ncbi:hypothetical protein DFH07DRAFT_702940, partial [Mycena maculata]
ERAFGRGDVVSSDKWSVLENASGSKTGFQGVAPPPMARKEIDRLFYKEPRARALHPYLCKFFPVPYDIKENIKDERSTFFLDRNGQVFMFRSFRADWLKDRAAQVEEAHNILVGEDNKSDAIKAACSSGLRGPHMPIILGHHRQSSAVPYVTSWQQAHPDRVQKLLALPIIQRIIRWITDIVDTVFPGVAARLRKDAEWHEEKYGIKPLFGLFWNLCLNTWFEGQSNIRCGPHADKKNQVGVCLLLVYVLENGKNFNHTQRIWLVVWEAGIIVELPPWVLGAYPSALLYHFNVDTDEIEFVTTEGDVRPTRENSRPICDGDDCGRGSFVFFNQSTMRQGPITGYDTIAEAKAHGHSGTVDWGESIQEAFTK